MTSLMTSNSATFSDRSEIINYELSEKKKKLIYKKYRDLVSFLILFFSFPISCCIVLELRKKRTRDDEFSAFSKIMLNG